MEEKPCPVDRGKLLIGLECCCQITHCLVNCPYYNYSGSCLAVLNYDALAYINYLEEQLNAKPQHAE